jgi:hypothetical protein
MERRSIQSTNGNRTRECDNSAVHGEHFVIYVIFPIEFLPSMASHMQNKCRTPDMAFGQKVIGRGNSPLIKEVSVSLAFY